jgi:hypothetical protein
MALFERFETPVRCADDHVYTTIWIPFVSLKSVRMGGARYQRCPVYAHWSTVVRIDARTADPVELEAAALVHDIRIP